MASVAAAAEETVSKHVYRNYILYDMHTVYYIIYNIRDMRLLFSLLLVLVGVITLTCYRHQEYFHNKPSKIVIGDTVQCGIDVPNGKGPGAYYQYTTDTTLDWYPDIDSAKVFSKHDPKYIADCSKFTLGQQLGHQTNPSSTILGNPSGPNGSYGTLNTPDAELGNGTVPFDPVTNTPYNSIRSRPLPDIPISSDTDSVVPATQWSAPAIPQRNDIHPEVSVSDTAYTAMELQNKSSLLKDIQQIIHQELAASRTTHENHPMNMGHASHHKSDSVEQGDEYNKSKVDMSQYIKKNAIPCWGCSLDY